ncbi:hypothetical protein [Terasakiella pusilla]|uniref:hypothetical protein n=1 Tax=Terasakiella pusilla TaxID=64973 RepID=UPI00048E6B75|nr:hypothetical protein [Terasakiella pusilla]
MTCITKTIFTELHRLNIITSSEELSAMMGRTPAYARSVWCRKSTVTTEALFHLFIDLGTLVMELADQPETAATVADLQTHIWQELYTRAHAKLEVA